MICTELHAEKMKTLHSNAAAIKRILFFLQYKLVLCLSSTH